MNIFIKSLLVLSLTLLPLSTVHAASLLDRVNEALLAAGLPVNAATQQSFAAGVASGHYKTFEQLVNAMKWHKEHHKTTADTTTFTKKKLWSFTGVIDEVNPLHLQVTGEAKHGVTVQKNFAITPKTVIRHAVLKFDITAQERADIRQVLQRGSSVKVWYNATHQAVVIMGVSPVDQPAFWGPINCATCGTNTDHSDPATPNDTPPVDHSHD